MGPFFGTWRAISGEMSSITLSRLRKNGAQARTVFLAEYSEMFDELKIASAQFLFDNNHMSS